MAVGSPAEPDWLFPQAGVPEAAPPDWRPMFVDYLFIAFVRRLRSALPMPCR